MDAVHKVLGREIPVTNAVSAEGAAPVPDAAQPEKAGAASEPPFKLDMADGVQAGPGSGQVPEAGKKIPVVIVGNLTETEVKRLELIHMIQEMHQKGVSIHKIARITGKNRNTVKKYLEGDPYNLCRSNKHGSLDAFRDFIVNAVQDGLTRAAIARQLEGMGYTGTVSNARQYICSVAHEYGLEIAKYSNACLEGVKATAEGRKPKPDYITRKGIFNHLWMVSA